MGWKWEARVEGNMGSATSARGWAEAGGGRNFFRVWTVETRWHGYGRSTSGLERSPWHCSKYENQQANWASRGATGADLTSKEGLNLDT